MKFRELLRCLTPCPMRPSRVRPGLYHYTREADGQITRFHLRVGRTGDGLLLANAAAMARLSPTGVLLAKGLLEGKDAATVAQRVMSTFRGATIERVREDVAAVDALIARLQKPDGGYPIIDLALGVGPVGAQDRKQRLLTPFSADVRLCSPFQMRQILDRLWELGIPHATIIVGRDPDETALLRAVEHAGDLGMIVGVRGRGTDLGQGNRIADMVAAGLDHMDVYYLSAQDEIHDALAGQGDRKMAVRTLAAAQKLGICPVAQLALVRPTIQGIDGTLRALATDGLGNASIFAIASENESDSDAGTLLAHELVPAARAVEELSEQLDVRLTWYPTVQFDASVSLGEQVCRGPRSSGDTAIRIEPDGAVFVARGPFQAIGNLITQDWDAMCESELYERHRARLVSDTRCDACPGLTICDADCPREPAGWAAAERNILNEELS